MSEFEGVPATTVERVKSLAGRPYMIVSADDHAGPRPSRFLREYCPAKYLEQFDEFCAEQDALAAERDAEVAAARERIAAGTASVRDLSIDQLGNNRDCAGHYDASVRLADMDADGVAAQVIFAGGQNDTELPWVGFGWNAGPTEADGLRKASYHMWNQWLADYVTAAPERLRGVMQLPIWDIDAAIDELEWCAERGLHVINLHAPREDYPPYVDPVYQRFWDACEAANATLVTHAGASVPYEIDSKAMNLVFLAEFHWFGNRGLTQLILGGVFERNPGLKFVLTEQRADFAPMMMRHLDSLWKNRTIQTKGADEEPAGGIIAPDWPVDPRIDPDPVGGIRLPSEYWRDNCFLSGSFLAPFEVALRHEIGLGNLLWGSDYPHCEGTWPHTSAALRHTFGDVAEDEARLILGENAIDVYHLDQPALREVADRIGPTPDDLRVPVEPDEIPAGRSWAFREEENFT